MSGTSRPVAPSVPREMLKIGEFVTVRADRGTEFSAQIRWALGDEAGGVFLTPVDYTDWD